MLQRERMHARTKLTLRHLIYIYKVKSFTLYKSSKGNLYRTYLSRCIRYESQSMQSLFLLLDK